MMLNEDYKEMLESLAAEKVRFLVVGAYAMAAHGYPRSTMDIDIWVESSSENAKAVMQALDRFGAALHGLTAADLQNDDTIFQIGVAPRRIDIITGVSGLQFNDTYEGAMETDIDQLTIRVPSINALISNKQASGRPKDIADVKVLERIRDRDCSE